MYRKRIFSETDKYRLIWWKILLLMYYSDTNEIDEMISMDLFTALSFSLSSVDVNKTVRISQNCL